jgi:hypothetical protein
MPRFISAIVVILTVGAARGATDIPEQFWSKNPARTAPLWIAARAALDHQTLRPGVVADHEAAALRRHLGNAAENRGTARATATPDSKCAVTFGALFDDAPMPSSRTLDDVRRYAAAELVVEGIVVGSEAGLYAGTPFTVVEVRVTGINKPGRLQKTAYLLIPKATLSIDGVTLCTSDPRYGDVPANGDDILFVADTPVDSEGTLFRIPAEHLFVSHDGTVLLSRRLRRSAEHDDMSLKQLRELLGRPMAAVR